MDKMRVCVAGATGAAGQNIVEALSNHPWFQVSLLAASQRSAGKSYSEAIKDAWFLSKDLEKDVLETRVVNLQDVKSSEFDIMFSALPSETAPEAEARFAKDRPVFSTTSAYRYRDDAPILVPEVNPDHVSIIEKQKTSRNWRVSLYLSPTAQPLGWS